jgi:hypothetical protein
MHSSAILGPELMQRLKNNKKRLATLTGRSCNKIKTKENYHLAKTGV